MAPGELPGGGNVVPGQIVVTLATGKGPEALNAAFGTTTLAAAPPINAYLLAVPQVISLGEIRDLLAAFPGVLSVDFNWLAQSPESEQRNLAFNDGRQTSGEYHDQAFLQRILAPNAHLLTTGCDVLVAILDTGVDLDHPNFNGHIATGGYDFVSIDSLPEDEANGIDEDGDGLVDEAAGHGTHVAGLVLLGAPGVQLLPVRVLDSEGWGDSFGVTRGIIHAASHGARVINLSLGLASDQAQVREAIHWAARQGAVLVASAGNAGRYAPEHYPAAYSDVIAVTATDDNDLVARFSNYGQHIDLCAPGVALLSTYLDGRYAVWSGTSMATPLVSAGAALVIAFHPSLDRALVGKALTSGATSIESLNLSYPGMIGSGRVNLRGALDAPLL